MATTAEMTQKPDWAWVNAFVQAYALLFVYRFCQVSLLVNLKCHSQNKVCVLYWYNASPRRGLALSMQIVNFIIEFLCIVFWILQKGTCIGKCIFSIFPAVTHQLKCKQTCIEKCRPDFLSTQDFNEEMIKKSSNIERYQSVSLWHDQFALHYAYISR